MTKEAKIMNDDHLESAFSVAKKFCELSGWSITNLKLQKIIYLTHMVYMGRNSGLGLVEEPFQAWMYGPVQSELYHKLKAFGDKPVLNVFDNVEDVCPEHEEYIGTAYSSLGKVDGWKLVEITHRKQSAWSKTYEKGNSSKIIPDELIIEEYKAYFSE